MSTPKHTPGPWEVTGPHSREVITANPGTYKPCMTIAKVGGYWDEEAQANAALIAAAPAMYEALQQSLVLIELAALEEWGREVTGEHQPPTTEARDRLEKVKAALAQAEGK